MKKYPNRLNLTKFTEGYQKVTKEEREKKELGPFTNLYVEKLPVAFNQNNVYDLFSKYGSVTQVKMKKPDTNIQFMNVNSLPCSAYVNFNKEEDATRAMDELNG
jgi:RNA recognition motif-containing protein